MIPFKLVAATDESGERIYTTPAGNRYPSVTTVLSVLNDDWKTGWIERVGEKEAKRIGGYATRRGKIVHEVLEAHLKGVEIQFRNYMPDVRLLLKSILPALADINSVELQESSLWSDELRLAGTIDLLALVPDSVHFDPAAQILTVIDFKTSANYKKLEWVTGYLAQCAGYAVMVSERYNVKAPGLRVIVGNEMGTPAQVFNGTIQEYLPLLIQARDEWEHQRIA